MTEFYIVLYALSAVVLAWVFISDEIKYEHTRRAMTYGDLAGMILLALVPGVNTCFATFFLCDNTRKKLSEVFSKKVF